MIAAPGRISPRWAKRFAHHYLVATDENGTTHRLVATEFYFAHCIRGLLTKLDDEQFELCAQQVEQNQQIRTKFAEYHNVNPCRPIGSPRARQAMDRALRANGGEALCSASTSTR